uniref:Uncharacterized protein n=1 Tax=Brassica oleracea var. oleracea TaxID=109376 RepID=A0A0D3DB37_BRAOL
MLSGTFFMAHTGQTYNRRRPWPPKLNLPGTFCIPLFLLLVKGFRDNGALWDWRARENGIYLKVWAGEHEQGGAYMHKVHDWIY